MDSATPYENVQCCTSDLTLAEFRTLRAKRDGANSAAATLDEYLAGTPGWTTDEAVDYGTLLTHAESITLQPAGEVRSDGSEAASPRVEHAGKS